MTEKLFDAKCLELAEYFLEGKSGRKRARQMAEEIQDAVDDFLTRFEEYDRDFAEEMKRKETGLD